jgi:plastocyanin
MVAAAVITLWTAAAQAAPLEGRVDPSLLRSGQGAVVYVELRPGESFGPPPAEPTEVVQRDLSFVPRVTVVQVGTKVRFPNRDRVRHNVFSPSRTRRFNLGIYLPGESREVQFDTPGTVTLLCNIHENMNGYVLVVATPFFAAVRADGTFSIASVPEGPRTVTLWREGQPLLQRSVTVGKTAARLDFSSQ